MAAKELIKKAGLQVDYTKRQLIELAKCAMPGISNDYGVVYFIKKYVKIQTIRGEVPFKLFDFQIRMLDAYVNNRHSITLASRQVGKTALAAAYILWKTIFTKDFYVLIASLTGDDSKDIQLKIKFAYEELPDWLRPGIREYNVTSMTFDNGSRIVAKTTSERTGRGKTPSLLYIDEMAFLATNVVSEFWAAILPGISTGGSIIITSTPNTDHDKFSELWHGAIAEQNGFHATEVKWDEHPDRDDTFRQKMISQLGELTWRREYNNEFLSNAETLISALRLQTIEAITPITIKNNFKFWDRIVANQKYVIGVDVGTGTGGDYSTIQCFSFPQLVQVAEFRENTFTTPQLTKRLIWLLKLIDKLGGESFYSFENNGVGEGVVSAIELTEEAQNVEIPGTLFNDVGKGKRGFYTSNKKKLGTCMSLKNFVDTDNPRMTLKSKVLLTELKFYIRTATSFEAKLGITDDLIAALLVMIRVVDEVVLFEDDDLYNEDDFDEFDDDEDSVWGIVC